MSPVAPETTNETDDGATSTAPMSQPAVSAPASWRST